MKKKKSTLLIVGMSFLLSIGTLMFSSCADKDDPSPILPVSYTHLTLPTKLEV